MQQKRPPFGTDRRGTDVVWPAFTGPSLEPRRYRRPAELWEQRPGAESWVGERVLSDLSSHPDRADALLILARYMTIRIAVHADRPAPGAFNASIERAAARDYLDALPPDIGERRWLEAVLDAAGRVSRALVARLNAAAAAAGRSGHLHGEFALRSAAWAIASRHGWHAEAARVARAIAGSAARAGGRRSRALWSRRARIQERRAAR